MRENFAVLAFMGESNSGKSFCADWAAENRKFVKVAFADVLKRFCQTVFEFTDEQLWGTSAKRNKLIQIEWPRAQYKLASHVDDWVFELDLGVAEGAEYKKVVQSWFDKCQGHHAHGFLSARIALQLLGTDFGREYKESLWTDYLLNLVIPLIMTGYAYRPEVGVLFGFDRVKIPPGVVITDCRFPNELKACQERGGRVIKLIRLSQVGKENQAERNGISGHASETSIRSIPDEDYDLILELKDGPEHVYPALENVFSRQLWDSDISVYRHADF